MTDVDDLLGDADVAMYQAKAKGKGRHQVFSPEAVAAAPPPIRRTPTPLGGPRGSVAPRMSDARRWARAWSPRRARLDRTHPGHPDRTNRW